MGSGATLDNELGATLAFVSNFGIGAGTNGGTVVNAGTLSKTGGTGTSVVAVPITETGTIEASSSMLSLQGGKPFLRRDHDGRRRGRPRFRRWDVHGPRRLVDHGHGHG